MRRGMVIVRVLMIGGSMMAATSTVAHAEWRYCLAPSDAARKVYLSDPFFTTAPFESVEVAFGRILRQFGLAYDTVQCPRGASASQAGAMRDDAIKFNLEFFRRAAVELQWTPGSSLAGSGSGSVP
jgi:hypothetical protein